jgi:hypothetical protein
MDVDEASQTLVFFPSRRERVIFPALLLGNGLPPPMLMMCGEVSQSPACCLINKPPSLSHLVLR